MFSLDCNLFAELIHPLLANLIMIRLQGTIIFDIPIVICRCFNLSLIYYDISSCMLYQYIIVIRCDARFYFIMFFSNEHTTMGIGVKIPWILVRNFLQLRVDHFVMRLVTISHFWFLFNSSILLHATNTVWHCHMCDCCGSNTYWLQIKLTP